VNLNSQPKQHIRNRRLKLLLFVGLAAIVSARLATKAEDASANTAIGGDAHGAVNVANLDNIPVEVWGVSGQNPASTQTPSLEVLVWDIQQAGDRVFVAGGFLNVQEDRDATPISQPYLAAFDLNTGDWISTCVPSFDRIVYALSINSRGKLIVGGEFTTVNGTAREGLVALHPETCEIDQSFAGAVERPWSTNRAMVREVEVVGDDLYIVGNFSHATGAGGRRERMYKASRMDARWGTLDVAWKPEVSGSSIWGLAVDTARNRVHFTGYFSSVNGLAGSANFHTVDTVTGASIAGLTPLPRNYPKGQPEMYDVAMGVDKVFVAGEQHIVQVLDADGHNMLGFHHTGNQGEAGFGFPHFMYQGYFAGGAYQVAERIGDVVFSGCHCTRDIGNSTLSHYSSYTDSRLARKVIFAYDATTGEIIESFDPDATVVKDGAWAVASDTNGCLYVGGDYDNRGVEAQLGSWAGGFIKMCDTGWTPPTPDNDPPDIDPPTVPTGVTATDLNGGRVQLDWQASADATGVQSYLVYRNGASIGWTPDNVLTFTDTGLIQGFQYSYEVRAVDVLDNTSDKSTSVTITPGGVDTEAPTIPTNLTAIDAGNSSAQMAWTASTDNSGLQSYLIYRNGAYIGWVTGDVVSYLDEGVTEGLTYSYEVRAVDLSNNSSDRSAAAVVTPGGADNTPPSVPRSVVATEQAVSTVQVTWLASTDNVGIQSYLIYRDGGYVGWSQAGTLSFTEAGLTEGLTYLYAVRAVDLAGNNSARSVPVAATLGRRDTTPPTVPTQLAASDLGGGSVSLTWAASTDATGIQSYLVFRNGAYRGWVPGSSLTFTDPNLTQGLTNTYELRAVDMADNRSARTSPVLITVGP
jgi:chitodextrinase